MHVCVRVSTCVSMCVCTCEYMCEYVCVYVCLHRSMFCAQICTMLLTSSRPWPTAQRSSSSMLWCMIEEDWVAQALARMWSVWPCKVSVQAHPSSLPVLVLSLWAIWTANKFLFSSIYAGLFWVVKRQETLFWLLSLCSHVYMGRVGVHVHTDI